MSSLGLRLGGAFGDWGLEGLRQVAEVADKTDTPFLVVPDDIPPANGGAGWPDALVLIGWLATFTSRIHFLAAVSSLGHQPYNLARRLASLDLASAGRVGWLVSRADYAAAHAAFSGAVRLGGVDIVARESEFVTVTEGLWNSWDADALTLDKKTAQFFKPEAMHQLGHNGAYFSVKGPLNVMRSPRGRPEMVREDSMGQLDVAATPKEALRILSGKAAS